MPFNGTDPLGTEGGFDDQGIATSPEDWRRADGISFVAYLRRNSPFPLAVNRAQVEDVVRVLGLAGDLLVGIVIRDSGGVRDSNARDLDFLDGFTADVSAFPDGVSAFIDTGDVVTVHLLDGNVTEEKIDDLAVTTAKLADDAGTTVKFADGSVTPDKLDREYVEGTTLGRGEWIVNDAVYDGTSGPQAVLTLSGLSTLDQVSMALPFVGPSVYDIIVTAQLTIGRATGAGDFGIFYLDEIGAGQLTATFDMPDNPNLFTFNFRGVHFGVPSNQTLFYRLRIQSQGTNGLAVYQWLIQGVAIPRREGL